MLTKGGIFIKRHGQLYDKICQFENIHDAYKKARKNKRYRGVVLQFTSKLEENLVSIQHDLTNKAYMPGNYRKFKMYDPKERLIMALPFRDRVVQHALNNVIEPIFDAAFIYHSYACRKGKGLHEASQNLSYWLYNLHCSYGDNVFCLKADVSKYFRSINHEILLQAISKKIKCKETLKHIALIVNHNGGETPGKGIPVGNLTSQIFANTYLHELDKFIKEKLRAHYYMRYMDDFLILSHDKAYLWDLLAEIENFLREELQLALNPKTCIFKVNQGIDFIGYRHWYTHKLIRKSSIKRITRKIKRFNTAYKNGSATFEELDRSMQSWLGHISHANTYNICNKILGYIDS